MNKKTLSTMIATAVLIAGPALAQHGGMGDHGENQGDMHGGHMMEDHSGMMEHMDTMMDHMSEMMQQMHEFHDQVGMEGHGHAGEMGEGPMFAWMQDMEGGMEGLMPQMESMMKSMHEYLSSGDSSIGDHHVEMQNVMTNMDQMVESCRNLMTAMHAIRGETGQPAGGEHEGHNH